jgi:hypothetical protein
MKAVSYQKVSKTDEQKPLYLAKWLCLLVPCMMKMTLLAPGALTRNDAWRHDYEQMKIFSFKIWCLLINLSVGMLAELAFIFITPQNKEKSFSLYLSSFLVPLSPSP